MAAESSTARGRGTAHADPSILLEREWQALLARYLPIRDRRSIWRHRRRPEAGAPNQGWKIHVSASVLSACAVFRRIAPYLNRRGLMYKAPCSLHELRRLNAGINYGFSQVGKFVTVYPSSPEASVEVALALDRLTRGQPAPQVPYDQALRPGSCVHYRFGAYGSRVRVRLGRRRVSAVRRPDGILIPDRREPGTAVPPWLKDPFAAHAQRERPSIATPLESDYKDYEALVQRGRGGVYRALDVSRTPPSACIIKEGRRHGETDWQGRDGYYRIQNEARFLRRIRRVTTAMPRVRATFRARGAFHLVTDQIRGRTLLALITGRQRISPRRTLVFCRDMSRIVADIHAAGWSWGDCKPANFLCAHNHRLRALDFESASRIGDLRPPLSLTPGFVPPRHHDADPHLSDLYALGASIAQVVTRKPRPPRLRRRPGTRGAWGKLPREVGRLAWQLLDRDPQARPPARAVERALTRLLSAAARTPGPRKAAG